MSNDEQRTLSTADLAAASDSDTAHIANEARADNDAQRPMKNEELAPLFTPDAAKDFRSKWEAVQVGFVDDPKEAVRHGDELVAQVMKSLAETFSTERAKLESQFEQTDKASTENLRVAFRRYRSFFERLLSL